MDMQVKRDLIRREREKRAWSQEHLGKVAGLGLRTVQRIEATGLASYESIAAIAAVLEMPASELAADTNVVTRGLASGSRVVKIASAIAATVVVATGVFFAQGVFADDVMLSVEMNLNDEERQALLRTADGKDAEIVVDGLFRLVIVPTVRGDGTVYLATQVYESDGTGYVLVSEPELATASDMMAEIRVSTDRGNAFTVMITPQIM